MANKLLPWSPLLFILFICCANKKMTMYEWYPSECCPKNYPIELVAATFIAADSSEVSIPGKSVINNGWGEIGSTYLVEPEQKPLPGSLDIQWFSYRENKFYGGHFDLDESRIQQLFEHGYTSRDDLKKQQFDRILVGLAPRGGVSIWVKGEWTTILVQQFKASEISVNWGDFTEGLPTPRAAYVRGQLETFLDAGALATLNDSSFQIPNWWMDAYPKTYNWQPKIVSTLQLSHTTATYFDGEKDLLLPAELSIGKAPRALPESLSIYWKDSLGQSRGAEIKFSFSEWLAAIALIGKDSAQAMNLQIEIGSTGTVVGVFLSNATQVTQFKKVEISRF